MTSRPFSVVAMFFCVWQSVRAQQPASTPPIDQMYRMPAVYSVPGMDKVQVLHDVVYKRMRGEKGDAELKFDIYTPADATAGKHYPLVVLISGGGLEGAPMDWRDAGIYQAYGRILAASGLIAIPYTKRYARGLAGTMNGAEDTRDLIAYLREHSAGFHVDKDRVAVWAFSAGGLMLAPFFHDSPAYLRAIACFYCVSDVTQDSWAGVPGVTKEQVERAATMFSSANQVHSAERIGTPLFVGRAGLDSPGLNRTIDRLIQEALSKNMSVEVWNHPTGRHGFDILDDNMRSREIIGRVVEFLRTNLKAN